MKTRTTTLVLILSVILAVSSVVICLVIFEKMQKASLISTTTITPDQAKAQASLLTNTLEKSGYTQAYKVNYANDLWTVDGIKNGQPYVIAVNSTTGAIESQTLTTIPVGVMPFPIADMTDLVYTGSQKYPDYYTYVATDKSGVYYVDTANHGEYLYNTNTHEVYSTATHEVYNTSTHETYDAAAHESAAYHNPAADFRVDNHIRRYARR